VTKSETPFNAELTASMLRRLDWDALRATAADLGIAELPEHVPEDAARDEAFLRSLHELIFDIHVLEGSLVCPHCGRVYGITKGIPNMVLNDDEV
jgi:multifunctional methyltransferase subunit TRM112